MGKFINRILRAGEGRTLKKLEAIKKQVNALEPTFEDMTDEELRGQTEQFKERIADGETLDELLPEAFATVREAARRTIGQRPYDVQIMGGAALHLGNIAEMKTGEGKTLVATLPSYLNALTGKGVHVVTVNDYLASYQSELMGRIHRFLGLTTGCILTGQDSDERRKEYAADITYGTNNEFGFDYLRDNMAWQTSDLVQRGHNFVIVDEVDSILIDEARTPLIISGPAEGDADKWYSEFARLALRMRKDTDYEVDEKKRTVGILEPGIDKVEDLLGIDNLYESLNTPLIGYLNNAIKAKELFVRDKDYIVRDGEVLIVDEHTGRVLPGRRYNEGMHQAIEAKEGVEIKAENQTLATITLQNYFRLYDKLSGMTGTAETEAEEFASTYKLGVVPIPTNKPMIREDKVDYVFPSRKSKLKAIVEDIKERYEVGQPVLVGTTSVEKSEELSKLLREARVPHQVLNAKLHQKEADIVALAGQSTPGIVKVKDENGEVHEEERLLGAVTIATNMAGRGTDIKLGEGVLDLGGLCVIGTERHESRRIDNQLRGRAGRQGDPGESQFYLSLEDELMRRFGSDRIKQVLERLNADDEDIVIKSRMLTRQVEAAQKRVEGNNYDTRKQVLQYDDVMREQREIIYAERYDVITAERDLEPEIKAMIKRTINRTVDGHSRNDQEEALKGILNFARQALVPENAISLEDLQEVGEVTKRSVNYDAIKVYLNELADDVYARQIKKLRSEEAIREFQKVLILMVVDNKWTDHIDALDQLRNAVGLRGYAQNNPIVEYQSEGFKMFQDMIGAIEYDVTRTMMKAQIHEQSRENVNERVSTTATGNIQAHQADANGQEIDFSKVGRNDFCPCGSGKKFKNCHGRKQF